MSLGYLTPDPRLREFDDLGLVQAGCLLHTYVSGSPSTPLAAYTDSALTIAHANPIVADAGGLFPAIYLTPAVAYKFVLTDALGNALWDQDPVTSPAAPTLAAGTGISLATVAGVTTITATGGAAVASVDVNDFLLTLESGVPRSTTDQLAKTTLYCTPGGGGNRIDLFDAAGLPTTRIAAEFSIAIPGTTNTMYDVFCYSNAGVPTLELLAWTNVTTRATAVTLATTGVWTKSGDLTRRLLGSVCTTGVSGQTEDSAVKRYLDNVSHRRRRSLRRDESAASWTYATATVRQANANVLNQVEVVVSVPGALLDLAIHGVLGLNSVGSTYLEIGIGEDSLTTFTVGVESVIISTSLQTPLATPRLVRFPAVGRHVYSWNENVPATGTTTFYAANNGSALGTPTVGLMGWIDG